jgi:hypothetical protein
MPSPRVATSTSTRAVHGVHVYMVPGGGIALNKASPLPFHINLGQQKRVRPPVRTPEAGVGEADPLRGNRLAGQAAFRVKLNGISQCDHRNVLAGIGVDSERHR